MSDNNLKRIPKEAFFVMDEYPHLTGKLPFYHPLLSHQTMFTKTANFAGWLVLDLAQPRLDPDNFCCGSLISQKRMHGSWFMDGKNRHTVFSWLVSSKGDCGDTPCTECHFRSFVLFGDSTG